MKGHIYVRWKPSHSRIFDPPVGPLAEDDPIFDERCPLCLQTYGGRGRLRYVAIGPNSEEAWERHQAGRWYNAQAVMVHDTCVGDTAEVTGEHPPESCPNEVCPRCGHPLDVNSMGPTYHLRLGRFGEVLGFHGSCLGVDTEAEAG